MQTKTDTVTYCNCMEEIRRRVALVQSVLASSITTGHNDLDIELIFVQFRKSLELTAFASLTANRAKYSAAHANFAAHCKAKAMLEAVEKLNPNYYPVPLELPRTLDTNVKHFEPVVDGYLTKSDFVVLYDKSSEILHARIPFSAKDPVVQIGYSVAKWIERIQRLLGLHLVHLVDDDTKWIVEINNDGPVKLYPVSAVDAAAGGLSVPTRTP